jgi:peptidyl-prolyl cis-trans isomerase SurA
VRPGKCFPALVLVLLLVAAGSTAGARVVDGVVAVVNNEPITFSEYRESVAETLGIPEGDADIYLREEEDRGRILTGLEKLIETVLVRQELKRIGESVGEKEVDRAVESVRKTSNLSEADFQALLEQEGLSLEGYRRRIRWQLERGAVVRSKKLKEVTVTEEEVRAYFRENEERFLVGAEVRLEVLVLPFPAGEAGTDNDVRIRIAAQRASDSIRSGSTLGEASRMLSSVVPGVEVISSDFVKEEDLVPEIGKEVHRLKTGETSAPIFVKEGVHLVKVLDRRGGTLPEFSSVKDSLKEELTDRRSEKAFADILGELKKAATVDIQL